MGIRPGYARKTVTRYSRTGDSETLPHLNVARWDHACGSYLTDEGDTVRLILIISKSQIVVMQVLLVTGGVKYQRVQAHVDYLDSTEVLEDMAGTWRLTDPLPSARSELKAATVENNIFVFGENILYPIKHYIESYNV